MLTKHNYKPTDINLYDKDGRIFKCCKKDTTDEPCTDCCYDTWKDELKEVLQQYSQVNEKAEQAKKKLTFAKDKSQRFKNWLDELNKAEDLARKICFQLEIIAGQSTKIWYNSLKAVKAIEILFCMVRDFYMQIDYIKKRYDELQNCINHNNDPALVKDQGILKCLAEYYKKLEVIINTRDEIIKAVIEALRLANLILDNISTQDCPKDYDPCDDKNKPCNCNETDKVYYGFKTIICEWYCAFECDEPCKPCGEGKNQQQQKHSNGGQQESKPCGDECELVPVFEFPICNNKYKCDLEECYKKAEEDAKKFAEDLKNANKQKEALLACKQSLEKAIIEVDPKNRCK
jgi:hypothetical protein